MVNGGVTGGDSVGESSWDFFISHAPEDLGWARWVGWQLEDAGFSVYLPDWNAQPGSRVAEELHTAVRGAQLTIAVVSEASAQAPTGKAGLDAALAAAWLTAFDTGPAVGPARAR
jgi:TIR domain-containing protein